MSDLVCARSSRLLEFAGWRYTAGSHKLYSHAGEGIAQGGKYDYFDDTGGQLTDGIYGINDWTTDLGNGNAFEWVGWRVADPVITFQFSGPVTINQVGIDFNRTETNGLIFLPNMVSIGGTDFTVATDAIPDASRGTLFFNGSWSGTTLTINLADIIPEHWIFVDEMTFDGVVVPEPSVFMLLTGGLGLLALLLNRTRREFRSLTVLALVSTVF